MDIKRILSGILIFALIFGQLSTPLAVLAQEATSSSQISEDTPEQSPNPSTTPQPSESPMASDAPIATSSATPAPTNSPTPTPQATSQPAATSSAQPNSNNEREQNKQKISKKTTTSPRKINQSKKYVEGEVLVKLKGGLSKIEEVGDRHNADTKDEIKQSNIAVLESNKSTESLVDELKKDPAVERVEPNYIRTIATTIPNDTKFSELWGLNNTGQTVSGITGTQDADIDAPEAWDKEKANQPDVIVAVIDTGSTYNHPDLAANMWDGSNCKDDNDHAISGGCPNHGWDYINEDNDPVDDNGHGTHVSGTIAGVAGNGTGVSGLSHKNHLKIMALKAGSALGYLTEDAIINSINFAKNNGAKVINASFGGGSYSQLEKDTIASFPGLFIAAAGNSGINTDTMPSYPAGYDDPNIIAVAATDQNDNLAYFSNYGSTSVDVGAPGVNVYSTYPTGGSDFTEKYFEDFDSVSPPQVPSGYTKTGYWGTKVVDDSGVGAMGGGSGTALYGDTDTPYKPNSNYTVSSPTIDLSNQTSATIGFRTRCDTQYEWAYTDFMKLEYSKDGQNFNSYVHWDEVDLDLHNGQPFDGTGYAESYLEYNIPSQYLTKDFKFQFRWVSDGSITGDLGLGCFVDVISVNTTTNTSSYGYKYLSGTSMATPHVVGLAGMLFSYKLSLTPTRVKQIILDSGDLISALSGKTVSGKRINLNNALQQAVSNADLSNLTLSQGTLSPNFSTNIASYSATVAYSIKNVKVTPTASDLASTIKVNSKAVLNGNPSDDIALNVGNNLISVEVTAENGNTKTYSINIERLNDTQAPVLTISKSPNKLSSNTGFTITINFDDSITKEYKLDSSSDWVDYNGPLIISAEGFHTLDARGTDEAGNTGFAYTTFKIDKTAPVLSEVTAVKSITNDNTPDYTFNSNEAGAVIYGGGCSSLTTFVVDGDTKVTFDSLVDGSYDNCTIKVVDEVGNISQVLKISPFVIDRVAPLTDFAINNADKYSNSQKLNLNFANTSADTVSVEIGEGVGTQFGNPISFSESIPYALQDQSDGQKIIRVRLTDAAGNTSMLLDSIILDTTAPTISNTTLDNKTTSSNSFVKNGDTLQLTATIADVNLADISSADIKANLSAVGGGSQANPTSFDKTSGLATWTIVASKTSEGFIQVSVDAKDQAGNSATQVSKTIEADNSIPVAKADYFTTAKNTSILISSILVLANDTDSSGDILLVSNFNQPVNGTISSLGSDVIFTPDSDFYGTATLNYMITDGANSVSGTIYITVTPPVLTGQTVLQPNVNLDINTNKVVVVDAPFDSNINVPSTNTNAGLDLSALINTQSDQTTATLNGKININATTSLGNVSLQIPQGITISGPSGWDGTLNLPTVQQTNSVKPNASTGTTATTTSVLEVGFGDTKLTLSKAVRLVIPNMAGQKAGYSILGVFTAISTICSQDTQTQADALTAGGDCKIDSGSDLVIWTKHFTKFLTYTETSQNSGQSGSSSTSSSGSSYNTSAPVCGDTKPASAPKLLSAVASGPSEVTLTWSKAQDPVSYYLVAYGTEKGKVQYGNPNVGDKNTTTYTVQGLSGGTTYYFVVRAGNNCMPGIFSNELSVTAFGNSKIQTAQGFQKGVLSTQNKPSYSAPISTSVKSTNPLINLLNIFKNFTFSLFSNLRLISYLPTKKYN